MKTITKPLSDSLLTYPVELLGNKEDLLFVDIETTGFAARSSQLYLIGCVSFEDGHWTITQFFAQSPNQEKELLLAFFHFCRGKKTLLHYNGNNFDLPYLKQKYHSHGMEVPFRDMDGIDLYKRVMPYKQLLGVENLKQKTMEQFLSITRTDTYDGGQLINIYRDYVSQNALYEKQVMLQNASEETDATHEAALQKTLQSVKALEKILLLHNADDMTGMFRLLPLLAYSDLLLQPSKLTKISAKKVTTPTGEVRQSLLIRLRVSSPLPKDLQVNKKGARLSVEKNEALLEIPLLSGELKYFYSNYKDYYYLPAEDTAMHKSVATFVSPEHRTQATAATCYTRKEGTYLPQWDLLFEPVFRTSLDDPTLYFELTDELKHSPEQLYEYALHILDFMMHERKR
ncbi:MAG: ribonuclease H-like domain-containing protein [Lachnospiraceae bacterium]|nr:ribonuclease H-like domain-containing protein [Lachnospiraceae bacterium]